MEKKPLQNRILLACHTAESLLDDLGILCRQPGLTLSDIAETAEALEYQARTLRELAKEGMTPPDDERNGVQS